MGLRSFIKRYLVRLLPLILLLVVLGEPDGHEVVPAPPPDSSPRTSMENVPETTAHWQGEMVGEVTQTTAILQARLTVDGEVHRGDVEGQAGVAAFVISRRSDLSDAFRTRWLVASREGDYIVKLLVNDLAPGTRYYYRLLSGAHTGDVRAGPTGTFRTLDPPGEQSEVSLAVVTGLNRFAFHASALQDRSLDTDAGFTGLEAIVDRAPDYFVGTGDTVYYDSPFFTRADTRDQMRGKWHRQFATPRFAALFQTVATYWMKDDHDFRYNDADPHGDFPPSAELGIEVFLEQVPVVDPEAEDPITYRTFRINDLLQIWLVEGRDYRDPNIAPPGPGKTLWGDEQSAWLRETLLASDAPFRVLISPTPMVGPDDDMIEVQGGFLAPFFGGRVPGQEDDVKRDNHTNPEGFRDEAEAFFDWLVENDLQGRVYLVCGDRHWQYHSIHPDGIQEFSVGALVEANSRAGSQPGDPLSTDPLGLVDQPYVHTEETLTGGFLELTVRPGSGDDPATIHFDFYDEHGTLLYHYEESAN